MHILVFLLTLAENEKEALSKARNWIDNNAGKEFFDYGELVSDEAVLVDTIKEELKAKKEKALNELSFIEQDISMYIKQGDRKGEGWSHVRYGKILLEHPTSDMPFYNIEECDWSIPTVTWTDTDVGNWYAVNVDLHI